MSYACGTRSRLPRTPLVVVAVEHITSQRLHQLPLPRPFAAPCRGADVRAVVSGQAGGSMSKGVGCLAVVVVVLVVLALAMMDTYNSLVGLSQATDAQWANVESAYQRRADLIPNLVKTVEGAANFEKSTLEAVVAARASVGQA